MSSSSDWGYAQRMDAIGQNGNTGEHYEKVQEYLDKIPDDNVHHPKHYAFFGAQEVIEIIAGSMTQQQFYGYCLGNKLKYHLRAGKKGSATEDLAKAAKYDELYIEYVRYCRED